MNCNIRDKNVERNLRTLKNVPVTKLRDKITLGYVKRICKEWQAEISEARRPLYLKDGYVSPIEANAILRFLNHFSEDKR